MTRKRGRCGAGTFRISCIIAEQSQGKRSAARCRLIAARAVQDVVVEGHGIPRFHRKFDHCHAFGVGIGDGHVRIVVWIERCLGQPAGRQHWFGPFVRSRDAAQGRVRNRIKRRPEADVLRTFNEIIRAIGVPRCRFGGTRFFD